jgi:hypothetical protein
MGLASCAVSGGDDDRAIRALELNWPAESTVGEFVLGSRPAPGPAASTDIAVNDADWPALCRTAIDKRLSGAAAG